MADLTSLEQDPKNFWHRLCREPLLPDEGLAKAEEWNRKVVELDPKDKDALYTLGVIPWTEFVSADREARDSWG